MVIKLLVLDIDGTIAGESNQISKPVKLAIAAAQKQNIQVTLATGRMYRSALPYYEQIETKLPLIAYNGAWIQNPDTQEKEHLPIGKEIALELLNYFESPGMNSYFGVHCYLEDQLYVKEITPSTQEYAERSQVAAIPVGDLRKILQVNPTKVLAIAHQPQMIKKCFPDLKTRYSREKVHLTQSSDNLLEAMHPQVNKGKAVQYLTEKVLGIKPTEVMAIGDNFNDLEMLQYAGVSIAMGSAPPEIKQVAHWVAPDVEADGVAVAINKFLEKQN